LAIAAFEGLIRSRRDGQPVSPDALFTAVDRPDRLFVESLCSALHLANYRLVRPEGRNLFINVNPAIFQSFAVIEREFDHMMRALPDYGLSPSHLICEIVEKDVLSQEVLISLRAKLRELGLRVAVDDFGAGSSSLGRFHDLQPEIVKLDGAIFRRLADDPIRRKMLRVMARSILSEGSAVLVEGIESEQQLRVAIEMGATLFQGYFLGRPETLPHSFAEALPLHAA
jgi:EAL domain-containing protein (putative c-di-GMP-specific phosphodiesterase class I)